MSDKAEVENISSFLALTAKDTFWDKSKPIIYLGPWCLLDENNHVWEPLKGDIMRSPFLTASDAHQAYEFVNSMYESVLPVLANVMNRIHGVDFSVRYWRIVLGSWLQQYIAVVYDRYLHIQRAIEIYPNFCTVVLAKESFVTPLNTLDFTCAVMQDEYNHQLFSKVLRHFGLRFPTVQTEHTQNDLYRRLSARTWKHKALHFLTRGYTWLTDICCPSEVVFRSTYFPLSIEVKVFKALKRKLLLVKDRDSDLDKKNTDDTKRKYIQQMALGDSDFEVCLLSMLFEDMPQSFVENFTAIKHYATCKYPTTTKVIFSANSWYYDEYFKLWSAEQAEAGSLLLGTPHGGNYGASLYMTSVKHEMSIVDIYYSWGWERDNNVAEIRPMPATKLMALEAMPANNQQVGVLWVATSSPRYLTQFPYVSTMFEEYMRMQAFFLKALPETLKTEILFRPHYQDNSWGLLRRLQAIEPELKVDAWQTPFRESLKQCRLYVCDHLSTTFIEALAANKPTILFWSEEGSPLRAEAKPYFEGLKKQGILFHSPEDAAKAVAEVYQNIEVWWGDAQRQQTVQTFCDAFAKTSADAINLWVEEIDSVVENARLNKQ